MRLALVLPAGIMLAGAILLSGCGGGSDNNQGKVTPPSTDDAFVAVVRQQTDTPAAMSDTSESIEVARIVETSPENTEPQAVKF